MQSNQAQSPRRVGEDHGWPVLRIVTRVRHGMLGLLLGFGGNVRVLGAPTCVRTWSRSPGQPSPCIPEPEPEPEAAGCPACHSHSHQVLAGAGTCVPTADVRGWSP